MFRTHVAGWARQEQGVSNPPPHAAKQREEEGKGMMGSLPARGGFVPWLG